MNPFQNTLCLTDADGTLWSEIDVLIVSCGLVGSM